MAAVGSGICDEGRKVVANSDESFKKPEEFDKIRVYDSPISVIGNGSFVSGTCSFGS